MEHIQKLVDSLEQRISKFENKKPISQKALQSDLNKMRIFIKSYFELNLVTQDQQKSWLDRVEAAQIRYEEKPVQKTIKNKENTKESLTNSARATPIYNMGVTVVDDTTDTSTVADIRLQTDQYTFPRKLDNTKIIATERGNVPILHSVPCDREGFASIDWVSIGIGQETLGDEYFSINPDEAESILTYAIETFLDQHLYEIFGFGLGLKREKGMHRHKYGYVLQNDFGLVLYGTVSKRITIQINGTGCANARKGWEKRLHEWLNTFARRPKITRVDLAHDDFDGQFLNVDVANEWDNIDGFWCGGRAPEVQHFGSWKRITGKGRTLSIGNRTSGKYCRIYEKGKKEGNPLSLWTRAEVEFKASDRYIPFDVLLRPSRYFLGAYPCFEWLARQLGDEFITPEKTEVIKKQSEIGWNKALEITKVQFGKYIRQFAKFYEPDELVQVLSSDKDEVPKRLKFSHVAVIQSIRSNQQIESKTDEMPLFVGVPLLNQSSYKEFIHAI
ncbi:replication initiation factor domain-containing protein [Acinetobacter higginsii]|uniref:replication initiation factor domain-containing protein n=1 Tax=Acinetobacter higginsii TaxID=70347 RepID=UPI001F609E39|nr:replication initiation factor domain-containing protein [Acinetobacter higginsii]MCI3881262.1 replication initiation factor domain-containing protein [Acinetobacter higginsii]